MSDEGNNLNEVTGDYIAGLTDDEVQKTFGFGHITTYHVTVTRLVIGKNYID